MEEIFLQRAANPTKKKENNKVADDSIIKEGLELLLKKQKAELTELKKNEVVDPPLEDIKANITKPSIESEIKIKRKTREVKNERKNKNQPGRRREKGNDETPSKRKGQGRTAGGESPRVPGKGSKGLFGIPWW